MGAGTIGRLALGLEGGRGTNFDEPLEGELGEEVVSGFDPMDGGSELASEKPGENNICEFLAILAASPVVLNAFAQNLAETRGGCLVAGGLGAFSRDLEWLSGKIGIYLPTSMSGLRSLGLIFLERSTGESVAQIRAHSRLLRALTSENVGGIGLSDLGGTYEDLATCAAGSLDVDGDVAIAHANMADLGAQFISRDDHPGEAGAAADMKKMLASIL